MSPDIIVVRKIVELPSEQSPSPIHWHEHDRVHVVSGIVVVSDVDVGNVVVVVIVVIVVVVVIRVDVVDDIGCEGDGAHCKVEKGECAEMF